MFFFCLFFIKTYQPPSYLYHNYIYSLPKTSVILLIINNIHIFAYYLFFPLKFINNASTSLAWVCFPLRCNHFIVFFR